jgi:tetratricopeptide (TPR) repeat protein
MNLLALWDRLNNPDTLRVVTRAGLVVAAVAVIAGGGWAWYQAQESRGEAALAEATSLVQQAALPQPPPDARAKAIKALETVIQEHSRFSGVPQAAYQLGNLRFAAGQYGPARAAYELALAKGAKGSLRALSSAGIGYTWEAEKNWANAATAYEAALKTMTAKDFLYEDTLMALARAQELGGKPAVAVETYQRILRDVPDTRRVEDLKIRLASLKSRAGQ